MNGKFSKWNKRVTAWLLLIAGFYTGLITYVTEDGIKEVVYDDSRVMLFLGSGLMAVGLWIYQGIKHKRMGDIPDPGKQQK
jgi:hypothetical protein